MKQNDYEDIDIKILDTDLANAFHVYGDPKLGGPTNLTYNVNRTFNVIGIDNIAPELYTKYLVKGGDTWTTISYNLYNTTRLWWLICKMNGITNPTVQPEIGEEIYILREGYVKSVLDQIKQK